MAPATEQAVPVVESFLRRFHSEILSEWRGGAPDIVRMPAGLSSGEVIDHIPDLIDELASVAQQIAEDPAQPTTFETARRHALDRLGEGFGVAAVVKELSLLRDCILRVWAREHDGSRMDELRFLNLAIDRAIEVSLSRFAAAHERALHGVDRVSIATLESTCVDDLLRRLLTVFQETTPAVDTAGVMLAEGDRLRVRALVGLDDHDFSLDFGEGFCGAVAAHRKAMQVHSACTDPLVKSPAMRARGVLALYGVPLVHEGRVIGVAHMGSLSAHEFSLDDRQFFDSLIARATVGIVHQTLRQDLAASQARLAEVAAASERALAELESLLAASPVGIAFVDRDLRFLRINDALAMLNGHPPGDHIGRTVAEVMPQLAGSVETLLRDVMATGEPRMNLELTRTGATPNETRWLLANYFPVRSSSGVISGVGGIVVDVSDTKRAELALQLEQTRLRSIVDHAPAAIWIKDSLGQIILANQRTDEMLPSDIATQHRDHDAIVLRENRAIEVEETTPSADGPRTFLSIKFPIPGNPPFVGGIATEITHRKRMEEQLREAVRMREDLLAIVSHDLRGPLGTVQLSTSLLMSQLATDMRARRHLETVNRSCSRMEHLIADLLDTARLRTGQFQLDLGMEVIEDLVTEALDLQRPVAADKDIQLASECSVDAVALACDPDRILQVFGNLIGNAIKFCRAGDTITVTADRDGDVVKFSVRDTGPGIPANLVPHLFEPYWSGPQHASQGSGLGLFIVRGIIESHGGQIWVESACGAGARFFFTLPLIR